MDLWIPITILAALSQTIRTAIQRHMKGPLGDYGASAIRFIYAIPFAWLWFLLVLQITEQKFPALNTQFLIWLTIGGIAQILFTVFLIKLFSHKNFLVGIALSKTEVLLIASIEVLIMSTAISLQFGAAIFLGTISVILLSLRGSLFSRKDIIGSVISKSTYTGLIAGGFLAISVVAFRLSINSLSEGDFLIRATTAAAIGVVGQAIIMILFLFIFRKAELYAALKLWRPGLATGLFAAITTAAWFSAFALHRAAEVRAVGQIELIFSLAITIFIFKQKLTKLELMGVLLLSSSILLVILQ